MSWNRLAVLFPVAIVASISACQDKDDSDEDGDDADGTGDETSGATGGSTGATSVDGCPEEVPEEYKYLWDCEATTCDGGYKVYHLGEGTSDANGNFESNEDWYVFSSEGLVCIENFTINGRASDYDPETFKCSTCEEIYQVTWDMVSGNTCNFLWGYTFIGNKDVADGPFDGFLMFDTHNSFGDRNEDNAALVVSAMLNTNATGYYQDRDYGKGTVVATTSTDGPPENYDWVNTGACWN